jgi:peptide/nickel transport system substrate-binding protein
MRWYRNRAVQVGVGLSSLALIAAACSSSKGTSPNSNSSGSTPTSSNNLFDPATFNPPWLASNVNSSGAPKSGGTLKIEGSTDLSGALDPQGEYETIGYMLERVFTRQLVSYASSSNVVKADTVVADAATDLGTVSPDKLVYTFHIRPGVMWNTTPPRPVTSQDFLLGLKRNCDPTLYPNVNPGYYNATIKGFSAFCTPFEALSPNSTAAARAAFINGHSISGIATPDSSTIVFTLIQPASDFLNILAMPFSSAAPKEDLNYVPLTPGNPLYSDGPMKVSNYNVGHSLTFTQNTAWQASSDPIRHQYLAAIDVKLDLAGAAAASQVLQDMEAGTADLPFNTAIPTSSLAGFESPTWNTQFGTFPEPGLSNPYLVFNVQSPNDGGALQNVKVRQALEYAINKSAMGKIYGGPTLNQSINQVIPPGSQGYVAFNDYPTPNNQGDPAKCSSLLAAAGVKNLVLKDYYRDSGNHPAIFQEVQSDFQKCGVQVVGTPIPTGYYGSKGIGVTTAAGLKAGKWDITEPGWNPDWFGPNNGRAVLPDIVDGALNFPGTDWGGYDNPAVDSLVTQALAATTVSSASALWHQADVAAMADAPIIPFQTQLTPMFRSTRVHNALWSPFSGTYDLSQIWAS